MRATKVRELKSQKKKIQSVTRDVTVIMNAALLKCALTMLVMVRVMMPE
jgi:hypothetical protein